MRIICILYRSMKKKSSKEEILLPIGLMKLLCREHHYTIALIQIVSLSSLHVVLLSEISLN